MKLYKNYLKEVKRELIKFSIKKENNTKEFKEKLQILDRKTNSLIKLKHVYFSLVLFS